MTRDEARGVWLLALGQTTGYAAVFYPFAGLMVWLERGSGWSRAELALGPTFGLLVAALSAPLAGRLVDRGLGAALLGGGAALGAAALAALAGVQGLAGWYGLWLVLGLVHAATLFETCFSFLTRRLGPQARAAIIRVTLVAGLAATLSFPLAAWAGQGWGWRGGFLAYAALQLLVTLPANLAGAALLRRGQRRGSGAGPASRGAVRAALRRPAFWLIAVILCAIWLDHALVSTFSLPLLMGRGQPEVWAVTLASAMGPLQVAGRLALLSGGRGLAPVPGLRLVAAGFVLAALIMIAVSGSLAAALLFVALQGASAGIASILRPLVIAEVLGRESFGAIAGTIAMAPILGQALAPFLGAMLLDRGGVAALLAAVLALSLLALAAAAALAGGRPRGGGPRPGLAP